MLISLKPSCKPLAIVTFLLTVLTLQFAKAQHPVRYYFNEEEDLFVGIRGYMQFWGRYTELNPGSTINETPADDVWDISMRRYRMQMYGRISSKTSFVFELGNNNINYLSQETAQPRLLEAYIDHEIKPHFAVGVGKTAWTGLSRYATPSPSTNLGYDINFLATPLIGVSDDLFRKLAIYARGQYKKWDYRIAISKPYTASHSSCTSANANFSDVAPDYQTSFYVEYQFHEKEDQGSPYAVGTYLGKKKILNIGGGALYQPNTTMQLHGLDTIYYSARQIGVDLFLEHPLDAKRAVTLQAAYFYNDLGPAFLRSMGVNNPANGSNADFIVNGTGNGVPVSGTGHLYNAQLGYLRVLQINGDRIYVQPFASIEYAELEGLAAPLLIHSGGLNYFFNGHNSKLTLAYQNRPIFQKSEGQTEETQRKYTVILQYQLRIGY